MKEINILWVDPDHPESWNSHIEVLEENYGYKFTRMSDIEEEELLNGCKDKGAIIIHCGTLHPMAGIKDLLLKVRGQYPGIKIRLETNAIHPNLEGITDFYINKPLTIDELEHELRENTQ